MYIYIYYWPVEAHMIRKIHQGNSKQNERSYFKKTHLIVCSATCWPCFQVLECELNSFTTFMMKRSIICDMERSIKSVNDILTDKSSSCKSHLRKRVEVGALVMLLCNASANVNQPFIVYGCYSYLRLYFSPYLGTLTQGKDPAWAP